jgi:hypothetical protein
MSKKYANKVNASTVIRHFYAPGYSFIMMSYFNTHLSLRFHRYTGKDNVGLSQYDCKNGMTTTVNYEGAAYLYQVAMPILEDMNSEKVINAVLPCNKAALIFEYKPEQDNYMAAYLTIEKNDQSIPFRFKTQQVKVQQNGQMVTKVIQSGLGAFTKTVEGYLISIGADRHLSKLPENFETFQDENQQAFNTTTSDRDYSHW